MLLLTLTRALWGWGGGGRNDPPCLLSGIAQERKGIELQNFQDLFRQHMVTKYYIDEW